MAYCLFGQWPGLCICYTAAARKKAQITVSDHQRAFVAACQTRPIASQPALSARRADVFQSAFILPTTATRSPVLGSPLTRAFLGVPALAHTRTPPLRNLGLAGSGWLATPLATCPRAAVRINSNALPCPSYGKIRPGLTLRRSAGRLAIGVTQSRRGAACMSVEVVVALPIR